MRCADSKARCGIYVMRSLGCAEFARLLMSMLFSVNHYYILGKNLSTIPEATTSRDDLFGIQPLSDDDVELLEKSLPSLGVADKKDVLSRLLFRCSGFRNCYTIKKGGTIAFIQWIIFPSENEVISKKFSQKFYKLNPQQVMIENAFTFPSYRGRGYLLNGTEYLLRLAKDRGYKWAVCYIRKDRIGSLNEFSNMGFRITRIIKEYKFLGKVWRTL